MKEARRRLCDCAVLLFLGAVLLPAVVRSQERSHAAARVFLAHGITALEAGDSGLAVKLLEAAERSDPDDGTVLHWLGLSYLTVGRADDAVDRLNRCLTARRPPQAGRERAEADLDLAQTFRVAGPGTSPPGLTFPPVELEDVEFAPPHPGLEISLGVEAGQDSNPALLPDDVAGTPPVLTGPNSAEADAMAQLTAQLRGHPVFDRNGWTIGWSLLGQHAAHQDLRQLDLTLVEGTASLAWGGDPDGALDGPLGTVRVPSRAGPVAALIQAGGFSVWLDGERYLHAVEGAGALFFRESPDWMTRLEVELHDRTFAIDGRAPFRRSGLESSAGLSQTRFFGSPNRRVRLGFRVGKREGGEAFDASFTEAWAELASPLGRRWSVSLLGARSDTRFSHPISNLIGVGSKRSDQTWQWSAAVAFRLRESLSWTARGDWTDRTSNVVFPPGYPLFDYRRAVVTTGLTWSR